MGENCNTLLRALPAEWWRGGLNFPEMLWSRLIRRPLAAAAKHSQVQTVRVLINRQDAVSFGAESDAMRFPISPICTGSSYISSCALAIASFIWRARSSISGRSDASVVEPPSIEAVLGLEPVFWRETGPVSLSACGPVNDWVDHRCVARQPVPRHAEDKYFSNWAAPWRERPNPSPYPG